MFRIDGNVSVSCLGTDGPGVSVHREPTNDMRLLARRRDLRNDFCVVLNISGNFAWLPGLEESCVVLTERLWVSLW